MKLKKTQKCIWSRTSNCLFDLSIARDKWRPNINIVALDLLARAFTIVLALLRDHITSSAVTPTTLPTLSSTLRKKWNEKPGRPCFEIPVEMLEELRALGFSWTKIAELLGVSRWTVARRVEQHGLGDIRGFDFLPDEELDEIISTYIATHGTVYCHCAELCWRSPEVSWIKDPGKAW